MRQSAFHSKKFGRLIIPPAITVLLIVFVFFQEAATFIYGLLLVSIFIVIPIVLILKSTAKNEYLEYDIKTVDQMSGIEFEKFLMYQFKAKGFSVDTTPKSGDFGADLILRKNGIKTVVQAKRYGKTVGIRAIQEIIAAKTFYHADKAIVATNNTFTKNAKQLAFTSDVRLIDRRKLIDFMAENNAHICPECGNAMMLKKDGESSYYSCSAYPTCKYKKEI